MIYGLWFMVYGLWLMMHDAWFMVYDLGYRVWGRTANIGPPQTTLLEAPATSPVGG